MQRIKYDVIVVGGGIIGTATARELLLRHPHLRLAIVEKESKIAAHQSGHNSGVVHTGIYYTPGSLKAKLCVEGLDLAYKYFSEKNIKYKKCGKMIVAVKKKEIKALDALYNRAVQNGVKDISLLDSLGIKEIEPNIQGLKAIWSPNTGIVDWGEVTQSYAEDCKSMGADIYFNFKVSQFVPLQETRKTILVQSKSMELLGQHVVTCGGLQSDILAEMTGCNRLPRIIPFRGEYLVLRPEKSNLVKTNIYPVPEPGLPFLGVHITPRIDGSVWLGPNAVLALKREGYGITDIKMDEAFDILRFKGLQKLAMKHFSFGLSEVYRSINISAQVNILKQFLPTLKNSDVMRGPSGVRAQALDANGNLVDDFIFDSGKGKFARTVLHVRNAPSPAATSSLAIAKVIADKVREKFHIRQTESNDCL
ncbi:L-2-hydroxyglutarate dehydrogenase, mitochondrial [Parasteatoda tepidariorum]|nr:L-2-hydroxyglutarate dehydrogenase, mitochondrial [Parasteatoda tepidariorum]